MLYNFLQMSLITLPMTYQQLNFTLKQPQIHCKSVAAIFLLLLGVISLLLFTWDTITNKIPSSSTRPTQLLKLPLPLPENSLVDSTDNPKQNWLNITVKAGDSLASIFARYNLSAKTLQQILNINEHTTSLQTLQPGQSLQILINNDNTLAQLVIPINIKESLIITHDGDDYSATIDQKKLEVHKYYKSANIEHSLYRAAKSVNIPEQTILQLSDIFAWQIDFGKDLRPRDNFTILYDEYYSDGEKISIGDILAAKFHNQGEVFTAIRYTDTNGHTDYYTADGKNTRKAFLRYPVKYSHISSPFDPNRMHPILEENRPHKGVDLAAPLGTPIKATGDGKISYIGKNGGYGNMIKIHHAGGHYTSLYAHMLRFAGGLAKGSTVKQGQVIGYVGQSGLATGPHLHFEVNHNGETVNPVTVKLPQAEPVDSRYLDDFLKKAEQLMTQLDLYAQAHFASRGR